MEQELTFDQWRAELLALPMFRSLYGGVVLDDWREFYNQGYSPRDALAEELSHCRFLAEGAKK